MTEEPTTAPPANVLNSAGEPPQLYGEGPFLTRLFGELKNAMAESFGDWSFTIHFRQHSDLDASKIHLHLTEGKRNALLLLADEHGRFPEPTTQGFDIVFRQYMNGPLPDSRFHPFPVGYHEAAGLAESVPFENRKTNLFFSGYRNRNRVDLYKQFRKIWWLPYFNLPGRHIKELARRAVDKFCEESDFSERYPESIIQFTQWFGKGLPPEEYAKVLANTRIAVCPPGFISSETIRHWEAMRLGCVIVTAPLPDNVFYKNSPMVVMKDWSQFHSTIGNLLADPAKLKKIHEETVEWWEKHCCEKAIASYMAEILRQVQANPNG